MINSFNIEKNNGILKFNSAEDLIAVYDTLIYYSNAVDVSVLSSSKYENSNNLSNNPTLLVFGDILNFNSLYSEIEKTILTMENTREGYSDSENPDKHHIVSDFQRAVLSPNAEVIIGNHIFLYGREHSLMIPNENFQNLALVHSYWNTYGEEEGSYKAICEFIAFANQIAPGIIVGPSTLTFDFYVNVDNSLPCGECEFFVDPTSLPQGINWFEVFTWDFGDGTSNITSLVAKHTYDAPGSYLVTCTVSTIDGSNYVAEAERIVNINTCGTAAIHNVCINPGEYKFNVNFAHCNNLTPSSYLWKIYDGGAKTYNVASPTHTFNVDNEYTVEVTLTFPDGCVAKDEITVYVTGTGSSCKHSDKETEYYYNIAPGYRLKHTFNLRHFWPFHRIIVKSVHEKQKSNGKWAQEKAAYLWVSFEGTIYDYKKLNGVVYTCTVSNVLYPNGYSKTNTKSITYDYGVGKNYSVRNQGVKSKWKIKSTSNGQLYEQNPALQLH
ncbi:MAG: PKD domain-containing protein [Bacteroidales bacterium]|nr:PKD domain-containing protein [Bacteroidales bacterium]